MANRKQRRASCRICNRPREAGELFSARGKCDDCGEGQAIAETRQLAAHSGPYFEEWRRAVARSVGAVLPEELGAGDAG